MSEHEAEFLGIFRDEANERLDSIVEVLLALEAGNAGADAIDRLFRDVHTIKGTAGLLDLEHVHALAHAFEDVLAGLRESGSLSPELVDPLMRAADALRAQVNGEDTAGDPDLVTELGTALTGLRDSNGREATPDQRQEPIIRQAAADRRTIRVPAEKLDRLLDLVGESVLHRRRLKHHLAEVASESSEELVDELDHGDRLLGDLQEAAIRTRTLPLTSITGPFSRAVRDVAGTEDKDVELVVTGAETELDRVILEGLSDPLVHLLRNAVAHGIETPLERERSNKPRQGRIELSAEQRGGLVAVTVADDGRGVSDSAHAQAAENGSLVAVLTPAGYSTRENVTELAGRGVGLDAVRASVESFGGQLEIESEPGRGTRVTLLLPLTLALLDVLLVERGSHVFGLPLSSVQEAVSVTDILTLAGRSSLELRGESVPVADLAELLGAEAPPPPEHPPALVVLASGLRLAAICDRLIGEEEVVVKSLGPLLASTSGYLGASILGDGRIALLLDPFALHRSEVVRRRASESAAKSAPPPPKLLVVEDSFAVRELQRSILEAGGYRVETARNGREALECLSRDSEISLVVTDIDMPEMNGLELTQAIRAGAERSSLPIVIVSAQASAEDRQRGIDIGADAYMVKRNFDQQALLDTVGRLVGQ